MPAPETETEIDTTALPHTPDYTATQPTLQDAAQRYHDTDLTYPVYIPSYDRPEAIQTHYHLDHPRLDWTVVVNDQHQYDQYLSADNDLTEDDLEISGVTGITNNRRYIRNKFDLDQWYLTMDDNIRSFTALPEPYYSDTYHDIKDNDESSAYRPLYSTDIDAERLVAIFDEMRAHSQLVGAKYAGFCAVDNYYFREKKWRTVGYLISKVALIQRSHATFDPKLEAMEDFGFTADNLLLYGRVLINNYAFPDAGHYEPGGIGTYDERVPRKIQDCEYLMEKYPGLFNYKDKSGCHPKAELQIRFNAPNQVDSWRQQAVADNPDLLN